MTGLRESDGALSRIKFVTYLVILHNKLFYNKKISFESFVSCLEKQKFRLFVLISITNYFPFSLQDEIACGKVRLNKVYEISITSIG